MAAANSLAAGFTIFHLLGSVFTTTTAVLFVAIEMCAALLWALVLGSTRLGRQPTARIISCGMASLLLFYLGLQLATIAPQVGSAVAGFGFGGYVMLFYVPFNAALLTLTQTANRSTVMGSYSLVFTMVAMVVPLIGGALIDTTSFARAGAVSAVIVITAIAFTLCFARLPTIPPIIFHGGLPRLIPTWTSLALLGEGVAEGALWAGQPILAYHFLTDATGYGRLISLLGLIGAGATVMLGRRSDRTSSRNAYLLLGIVFLAVGAVLGLRLSDLWGLVAALGAITFGLPVIGTFLFAVAGDGGGSPSGLALWREVLLNSGRLCAVGILLVVLQARALTLGIFSIVLIAALALAVSMVAARVTPGRS